MESHIVMTDRPLASAMGSDGILREISSDIDFEKFFKITEVFLTDEAAVDAVEEVALLLKEQMSSGELDGKILLSTENNKNTRNGWDCTTPARKDQDSLLGLADVSNEDGGTASDISQDISVPSSASLFAKNGGTAIDSVSDNGTDTNCALPCTKGSISLSIKLISGNYMEESMVNDNLDDIGNALSVTEKAQEEILFQEILEGDDREAVQVEQSKGLDEHLQFEVPSCVTSKAGSCNIGSNSEEFVTCRLRGLPQACGTHVWIGEEGNIKDECPFQSISTEVHAQEIENYNEPMFGHASTVEVLSIGDVNAHGGCTKEKSLRPQKQSSTDEDGEPLKKLLLPRMGGGLSIGVIKYWCRRYQLFSRFDKGVKLDEEGWFSVTPEVLAKHHAQRSGTGTVIDCFVGVGGNSIQFAQKSHHVIAIDIDPVKIDYAQHNASIYGVADCIDFINGDFFQLAPFLKADVVFLSPPWGGPNYINVEKYDIRNMLQPKDGFSLFKAAQMIAPNIIMFLPRNVDLNQLVELSWLSCPSLALEVEKNYINGELKAITAYYGDISTGNPC